MGRFLSRDPVWDAANVGGWYTFVGNGPVSGRDPSGRQGGAGWNPITGLRSWASDKFGKKVGEVTTKLGEWVEAGKEVAKEFGQGVLSIPNRLDTWASEVGESVDGPYSTGPARVIGETALEQGKGAVLGPSIEHVEATMAEAEGREHDAKKHRIKEGLGFLGQIGGLLQLAKPKSCPKPKREDWFSEQDVGAPGRELTPHEMQRLLDEAAMEVEPRKGWSADPRYNPDLPEAGHSSMVPGQPETAEMEVGPTGMVTRREAAETIAHEELHLRRQGLNREPYRSGWESRQRAKEGGIEGWLNRVAERYVRQAQGP